MATRRSRVKLDLNSPAFQEVLFNLETADLRQVIAVLRRLRGLDWVTVYSHGGFNWEALEHIRTPNGAQAYSLRLSRRIRAVAYRDGDFLCLVSLHPDHDSAYER
ncbi:MAG TPA: hypothetical protein VHR45_09940 [Thermoanaerobaculia bacterium]|nr:hypothetical protein [Thermoanaerobaculia bacterium]